MDFMGRTYAIQASFLSQPLVFLRIFLLKLPYLLFDLGVLFMLPLFFKRQEHKKFAFLFWLFNPVVLIVSFVFGTRDIICVFFIILAFYLLYKERFFLGTLLLCIAILSKFQALFVAPFIIIFILKNRGRIYSDIKRKLSFFSSFILLIILFILLFPSLKWRLSSEIVNVWPHSYFFLTKIGEARLIYLFIFVYVFVLLAYWYFSDNSFENLWKFSLLGLLSLFALCFFHPQWFLAVIPFVCFAIIDNKELFKLFSLQVIFYFAIFLCWGNHLTVNLFAPINPTFILNLPDIKEVISGFFNTEILINIFWTIFIAITIFFMYMIIKSLNLKNNRISFIKNKG
nr:hypothetical protein [Nanoarchaeota archaeon]